MLSGGRGAMNPNRNVMKTLRKQREYYSTTEYQKTYLQSAHWKKIKQRMYRTFRACEVCKSAGRLNIHHITYNRLGYEKASDLIVLCEGCHIDKVHAGLVSEQELFAITNGSRSGWSKLPPAKPLSRSQRSRKQRQEAARAKWEKTKQILEERRLEKQMGTTAYYRMKREQRKAA